MENSPPVSGDMPELPELVVVLILRKLSSCSALAAAEAVCRTWQRVGALFLPSLLPAQMFEAPKITGCLVSRL